MHHIFHKLISYLNYMISSHAESEKWKKIWLPLMRCKISFHARAAIAIPFQNFHLKHSHKSNLMHLNITKKKIQSTSNKSNKVFPFSIHERENIVTYIIIFNSFVMKFEKFFLFLVFQLIISTFELLFFKYQFLM